MKKIKILGFYVVAFGLVVLVIFFAEATAGLVGNVSHIRQETHKFVSEAGPLSTSTRRLQPNLSDEFADEHRSSNPKRLFRTDDNGLVLGPGLTESLALCKKILFLGGSTTENNEVDEQYRFPFLSAYQLSKNPKICFEGVNAGVRGHTTQDSLNLYLNHPSPKIKGAAYVVVMHNINDRLRLTLSENYKSVFYEERSATLNWMLSEIANTFSSVWHFGVMNSNLLFLMNETASRYTVASKPKEILVNEKVLDQYLGIATRNIAEYVGNLKVLAAVIRANNQTPIFMTQPLGRRSADQDRFNEAVRQVALNEKIFVIDLAEEVNRLEEPKALFYDDDIHFNNAGSRWASGVISEKLRSLFALQANKGGVQSESCLDIKVNGHSLIFSPLGINVLNGRYPSFDPQEKRILFQKNGQFGSKISVLDVKNGKIEDLIVSKHSGGVEHPTWVDETHVLYTEKLGDRRELFILNILDRTSVPLLSDKNLNGAIGYFDGKQSVYFAGYTQADQMPPRIYVQKNTGEKPVLVTSSSTEYWRPFVGGNGYIYYINNETGLYQVYATRLEDHSTVPLRVAPSKYEQWDPALSSDGNLLAFAQREAGEFDIYIKNLKDPSSMPLRILDTSEDEWDPRFSPKGRYLLYAATSPYGDQIRAICVPKFQSSSRRRISKSRSKGG
jgi:hypothetical protein